MQQLTRVAIVEDHPLMLSGVRNVLAKAPDVSVVVEAQSGEDALRQLKRNMPDVVLLDISLPDIDGITLLKRIKAEFECAVVMLTVSTDEHHVRLAIDYGASGYLSKSVEPKALIDAVRSAKRGQVPLSPDAATRLVSYLRESDSSGIGALTEREREVWRLLAQGYTNGEIAKKLYVSLHTVKFHVHNLLAKLGMKRRSEAISAAHEHGLFM